MKKLLLLSPVLVIGVLAVTLKSGPDQRNFQEENNSADHSDEKKSLDPNDHWYQVRSYPFVFDQQEYVQRMQDVQHSVALGSNNRAIELTNPWIQEGPGNIGGRFNALCGSPSDPNIIYAGAANGGIFKTTNGGATWTPIFDDNAYLAVGEIELDPNDEDIVYVGTGDKNFGGGSHLGNGVYRSTDAGTTWTQIGLEQTAIITEIIVDPTNSNRIFVSTLGNTYEKTTERGVYRSLDGGANWQNVLFISDSSGVIDMVMDPSDPDVLYASGFNRINLAFQARAEGPDAKIFKTTDGGDNWVELTNGLPGGEHSRIGLAISNLTPTTLYAVYTDDVSADVLDVYKTTDGGSNWTALNVQGGGLPTNAQGGFGWYFGEIYLNPYDNNQLIIPGVNMYKSQDGGLTWTQNVPDWQDYTVHADKHAILFLSATAYIIATDGGLYKTTNNGTNWADIENIPVTQFYHVAVDKVTPGVYGGGAQDNGCMSGNAFQFNFWERLWGGDGFRMKFLESDFGGYYFESQNGGIAYFNTNTFDYFDLTIPTVDVNDRVGWDAPYVMNENTYDLFAGSAHVQLMEIAPFGSYQTISGDLTKVATGSFIGSDSYHYITEIEQSLINTDKLYAGTSDGFVWRGIKTGSAWNWTNVTGTLPDRYVTCIDLSPDTEGIIYAAFSGYKYNEEVSYLYRSSDDGVTWQDISSNLPGITVNDIYVIPNYNDQYIFAALDGGVYFTSDGGGQWDYVGLNLPFATISELDVDFQNQKLIAGTYSRSMWSYDISWIDNLNGDPSAAISETENEQLNFYPNPASDVVYFTGIYSDEIRLYDLNGKLITRQQVTQQGGNGEFDVSALPRGIYFCRDNDGREGKLVKR